MRLAALLIYSLLTHLPVDGGMPSSRTALTRLSRMSDTIKASPTDGPIAVQSASSESKEEPMISLMRLLWRESISPPRSIELDFYSRACLARDADLRAKQQQTATSPPRGIRRTLAAILRP